MKKKVTLGVFILLISLGYKSLSFSNTKNRIVIKKKIEVLFNRKSHFDDLVNLRIKILKENGIKLNFKSLKFDEEGGLVSLEINVDCKDGFSGTAESDNLTNSSKFGFYRDYSSAAKKPFCIGVLNN